MHVVNVNYSLASLTLAYCHADYGLNMSYCLNKPHIHLNRIYKTLKEFFIAIPTLANVLLLTI